MTPPKIQSGICRLEKTMNGQPVCSEPKRAKTPADAPRVVLRDVKPTGFASKPKENQFRYVIDKKANLADQLFAAGQLKKTDIVVPNKNGQLVGVTAYEAKGTPGFQYLQAHQEKMGLKMIELDSGKRYFVPGGHATNFRTVSITQQNLERFGAIVKREDDQGVYYSAAPGSRVGDRFLQRHPELPQRFVKGEQFLSQASLIPSLTEINRHAERIIARIEK